MLNSFLCPATTIAGPMVQCSEVIGSLFLNTDIKILFCYSALLFKIITYFTWSYSDHGFLICFFPPLESIIAFVFFSCTSLPLSQPKLFFQTLHHTIYFCGLVSFPEVSWLFWCALGCWCTEPDDQLSSWDFLVCSSGLEPLIPAS